MNFNYKKIAILLSLSLVSNSHVALPMSSSNNSTYDIYNEVGEQNYLQPTIEANFSYGIDADLDSEIPIGVNLDIHGADSNLHIEAAIEGSEYIKLASQAKALYPELQEEQAITSYIRNSLNQGELPIFDPKKEQIKTDSSSKLMQKSSSLPVIRQKESVDNMYKRVKEIRSALQHAREKGFLEAQVLSYLRSNPESKARTLKGIQDYATTLSHHLGIIHTNGIKTLLDFINTPIYKDGPKNYWETYIEQKFNDIKLVFISEQLQFNDRINSFEFREIQNANRRETLALHITYLMEKVAPEVYSEFSKKNTTWLNQGMFKLHENIFHIINKSLSYIKPDLVKKTQFEHLCTLNELCKLDIEQGRNFWHKHSPAEKELLQKHEVDHAAVLGELAKAKEKQAEEEARKNAQSKSNRSQLQFNNSAQRLLKTISTNPHELASFKPATLKQLVYHNFIVKGINALSERICNSKDIVEQSLSMSLINNLLFAHSLNKENKIENLGSQLSQITQKNREEIHDMVANTLVALEISNASIESIKELITEMEPLSLFPFNALDYDLSNESEQIRCAQTFVDTVGQVSLRLPNISKTNIGETARQLYEKLEIGGRKNNFFARIGNDIFNEQPSRTALSSNNDHYSIDDQFINNEQPSSNIQTDTYLTELTHANENLSILYKENNLPNSKRFDHRDKAIKEMQTNETVTTHYYAIPKNVRSFLRKYDLNIEKFTQFTGNQLQHEIHLECIQLLERLEKLFQSTFGLQAEEIKIPLLNGIEIINELNSDPAYSEKTLAVLDLCESLLVYTLVAIDGAVMGAVKVVEDKIDHPTVTLLIYGVGYYYPPIAAAVFAFHLGNVAKDLGCIAYIYLKDPEQGTKDFNEYIKPVQEAYNKLTVENLIRETSKFTTNFILESKLCRFVGSLYKTTLDKAKSYISKTPSASPVAFATTPEGKVFRVFRDSLDESDKNKKLSNVLKHEIDKAKKNTTAILKGELFNFGPAAAKHLEETGRMIPINILDDIIKNPLHVVPDPRGLSDSLMYYSRMHVNKKLYNVEVLYDKSTNTIWHFLYRQNELGPLPRIK